MRAENLCGESFFQNGIFLLTYLKWHFNSGVNQRWICWNPHELINASIITPGKNPLPQGALGMNNFHHHWTYQVSYRFPPTLVPLVLSKFLEEHVTGQFRLLSLVAPCWIKAFWLPTVLNMLEDIRHQCPIIKDLTKEISVGWVLKDFHSLYLTLWQFRDMYCIDRGSLLQSVRQLQVGPSIYN